MTTERTYVGIDQDLNGGMTDTGKIIRDAWAFGLIPETETCTGWTVPRIEALWQQVQDRWGSHGFRVADLPEPIRGRYLAIQAEAAARARDAGWNPDRDLADED